MEQKIKNYVGIALAVGILAAAFGIWSISNTYSRSIQPSSFRSFSVSSEGKAVAVPDVAKFTLSVITEGGRDLSALQKENAEKMNKIIVFVEKNGVKKDDIKTTNYSIEPRYQYFVCNPSLRVGSAEPCPPPEIVGYVIREQVEVKARDFSKIGDILGGAVQSGANQVSDLSFTIDDPTGVESKARAEAMQKTREKAIAIAKAGGFGLGRVLNISEGISPPPISVYAKELSISGMGGDVYTAPRIEAGSMEVRVNITVTYEIR